MFSTLVSLSALFFSFGLLCLGHGLQNTLLGVRATLEHFPDWLIGMMMSGYFIGFLAATRLTPAMVARVGQIRTFAASASVFSATSLLHALVVDPYAWLFFRLLHGFSMACLYVVIESWLNAFSDASNRGRVLSVYMLINFSCLAVGQLFLTMADPMEFTLYAVASLLASFSLVPLLLSRTLQPENLSTELFDMKALIRTSPLATFGAFATGISAGAFWGMGAVYFARIGLSTDEIAWFMSLSLLGGLAFQWPVGYLSDLLNRRIAIAMTSSFSVLTSAAVIWLSGDDFANDRSYLFAIAFFFGGFYYPIYSLVIAMANDYLKPEEFTQASAGLLFVHGAGAIAGPLAASLVMTVLGGKGLFLFLIAVFILLTLFSYARLAKGRTIPEATTEPFVPLPRTGSVAFALDPRSAPEE